MIIAERKNIEEIYENLKRFGRVLVIGCSGCTGIHRVGGPKQAEELANLLRQASKKDGLKIEIDTLAPVRQCDRQMVESSMGPRVKDADAILSLACGEGVQLVADTFGDKWVFPANDTKFIGSEDREKGEFYELCSACGECILDRTGGICPITRCAKGLLNGPCGGQLKGKCEVNKENDCAWILIWKRMKERGRMDIFKELWLQRDRRPSLPPRRIGGIK